MEFRGNIYTDDGNFEKGIVTVDEGYISKIYFNENIKEEDYIIPALVDIHLHGAMGYDISDASKEGINIIAEYEKNHGIAAFCGASMTLDADNVRLILEKASQSDNYNFKGIYLEGPFISEGFAGAQKKEYILNPTKENIEDLIDGYETLIKFALLAPEQKDAFEAIKIFTNKNIHICIGHSEADYYIADRAFKVGASQVTHLYNGMRSLDKRNPGIPGAAFDNDAYIELIADGVHVSDSIIRMTFKAYDEDRIILISDSMRATGLSDGEYILGEQKVYVKGQEARLVDGKLAGSVTNLYDAFIHSFRAGVPIKKLVKAASVNPSKRLGIYGTYGTIKEGAVCPIVISSEEIYGN